LLGGSVRTTMQKILYFFGGGNGCAGRFLWVKPTLGVDFGDLVAGTTHANVPLRRQSWERATWMSRNIDLGVNFRLMRWDRKSAIWGGGRESGSFRFVRTFCFFDCCVRVPFMSFFDLVAGNSWVQPLIDRNCDVLPIVEFNLLKQTTDRL
jgi:hypothetical protein